MTERAENRPVVTPAETTPRIRWDDSSMRSLYSNVCNVTGTREEIVLLFGMHQAWRADLKELTVLLQERIILNPFAAKRLHLLLGRVLKAFETKYGVLQSDGAAQTAPPETLSAD